MKKTLLVLTCLILFAFNSVGQVTEPLWTVKAVKQIDGYGRFEEVLLNTAAIDKYYFSNNEYLLLPLTDKNGNVIIADMVVMPMNNVKVKINNAAYSNSIQMPKLFRGKIRGLSARHDVLLTMAPGYLSVSAFLPGETITLEQDSRNNNNFVLLNSASIKQEKINWQCGVPDEMPAPKVNRQQVTTGTGATLAASDKCIFVFVDCANRLFINQSRSVQTTINYVYGIWNGIRTAFGNEQLNVFISEINVWTVADPFDASSTTTVANKSFADYYKDNYWGNMAMLLDWSMLNAAIAGGYGWAKGKTPNECGNYIANPNPAWNFGSFIYNNLNPAVFGTLTYSNAPEPATAHQVDISTHELGHLFSSWHTHSCNWPGGPIDNCVPREGTCTAGPAPTNGGTFMSYCDQTAAGVNFNNGFGTLPGDTIRQFVVNNSCISICNECVQNNTIGAVNTPGFHQYEVSNQIIANGSINAAGSFIKLDAGNKVVLQPGFRAGEGSKVQVIIDGCGGIR